ncbi:hypothetical protein Nepgr_013105 [Nepenthes gracilis]|uniref:Auxin response factor n=1 Tax=Nepenthes gracilis TaxID=150966 RepID=A0AAD3XNT7_NEPGR|nr:hypothetical protein Nepgr_013105 [Nepenthes gracilis]
MEITNVTSSRKESLTEIQNCLDPQLWHACAGGMVRMPPVNSGVFYFPQGHIEHAQANVDFKTYPKLPAMIPCRISTIFYLADHETDEVYAKIKLMPVRGDESDFGHDETNESSESEGLEKPGSFAKTLTQSDANNGGGFSVPRYCAETLFPRLDYSAEPPVQTILAKDVHGVTWKFKHIYRGTPRRHLLTTGWSNFVNQKKLVAGDSIVFLKTENGDLRIGIRRAKIGIGGGPDTPTAGWNANCASFPYGSYASLLRDGEFNRLRSSNGVSSSSNGVPRVSKKVGAESVIDAATQAANGQPFEVVYYPRASTPEFCVMASTVRAAMQIQWRAGMRFKMAFETEDSYRISWFMGTISSVHVADPFHWPNSPWRLLQVEWDEPDLLQNVMRVNPWLVEPVACMPAIHMPPLSQPRKKLRLSPHQDFPFVDQLPLIPPFSSNTIQASSPLCCISNSISAVIQGARHAHLGQSLSDLHIKKLQSGLFSAPPSFAGHTFMGKPNVDEDISCLLTLGSHSQIITNNDDMKTPKFILFGKPILTEEQISHSSSGVSLWNSSSDGTLEKAANLSDGSNGPIDSSSDGIFSICTDEPKAGVGLETGRCKVWVESQGIGGALDLSVFGAKSTEKMGSLEDSKEAYYGLQTQASKNLALYRTLLRLLLSKVM